MTVQRWTGQVITPADNGGFVAVCDYQTLQKRCTTLTELLMRIRAWDMLDLAAYSSYWHKEIDAALAGAKQGEGNG